MILSLLAAVLFETSQGGIDFKVESETRVVDPGRSVFLRMELNSPSDRSATMPDLRDRAVGFSLVEDFAEEPRREKDGAIAVHFLNTTGENKKHGEKIVDDAPNPAFPQLKEDIVFTIPAAGATKATATSPEFSGERPLHVEPLPGGKVRVTVPKDLFSAYVFVRVK